MGFLAFLLLGLIAGTIAKMLTDRDGKGNWLTTLLLGVVGANVGGWLGGILFDSDLGTFWNLRTWVLAIGGSVIVLLVWGWLTGKKR